MLDFTVVGLDVLYSEASAMIIRAPDWVTAVRKRYLDFGEEGSSHQNRYQFLCAFGGELVAEMTIEALPLGPPRYQPKSRINDIFTVVGWDAAAQNGSADAVEACDAVSASHGIISAYKSMHISSGLTPFYQFALAFRGLHSPGPYQSEWNFARYMELSNLAKSRSV